MSYSCVGIDKTRKQRLCYVDGIMIAENSLCLQIAALQYRP